MPLPQIPRQPWTKPQIKFLGKLKDVSGAQGTGSQSAGFKT